jgi:uncharacterized protein (DUF2147 family)
MKTLFLYAALCITQFSYNYAQKKSSPDALNGIWLVADGNAKIKIEKTAHKYSGKIVWLNKPDDENGRPRLDTKNPDKALQSRPKLGLPLLKDFVYDEDNVWTGGTIYDPESGNTYSCKITMTNNRTIEIRGYLGIPLFGRTETWTRVENVLKN